MSVKLVPSTSCAANTAAAPQAPWRRCGGRMCEQRHAPGRGGRPGGAVRGDRGGRRSRSEEHTSELQSPMRISYAVFCLKKKKTIYQKEERKYSTLRYTTIHDTQYTR